jgi:hypothetical protein
MYILVFIYFQQKQKEGAGVKSPNRLGSTDTLAVFDAAARRTLSPVPAAGSASPVVAARNDNGGFDCIDRRQVILEHGLEGQYQWSFEWKA